MRIGSETQPRRPVIIRVDGVPVQAYAGETVAGVFLAQGRRAWRRTEKLGERRGLFCGIGVCFDCLVTVDGQPHVRACMTVVEEGMAIETHSDLVGV